jgi:hypothetical protein
LCNSNKLSKKTGAVPGYGLAETHPFFQASWPDFKKTESFQLLFGWRSLVISENSVRIMLPT